MGSGEEFYEVAPTLLVLCMRILGRRSLEVSPCTEVDTVRNAQALPTSSQVEWKADYGSIYSLLPHTEDLPRDTLEEYARLCLVAQLFVDARRNRNDGGLTDQAEVTSLKNDGNDTSWVDIRLLFRHLCQTHTNVYAIFEIDSEGEHGTSQ